MPYNGAKKLKYKVCSTCMIDIDTMLRTAIEYLVSLNVNIPYKWSHADTMGPMLLTKPVKP